jgi:hypothetical protein
MENLDLSLEPKAPRLPGGRKLPGLFERAYECLGSVTNDQVFMIADKDINDAKNFVGSFSCLYFYFLCSLLILSPIPFYQLPPSAYPLLLIADWLTDPARCFASKKGPLKLV